MDAAIAVLAERGMAEFTLSDIAKKVGLSRATVIQRFGDRSAILRRIAEHEVVATRQYLESLAVETGSRGLWRFLDEIIGSMGPGDGFSVRAAIAAMEAREHDLRALANVRYELVQQAIMARIPDRPDRQEIAQTVHALIAGATMQWVASTHPDLAAYVLEVVSRACRRLFPDLPQARN
ncbi:helix-turn-helix domain-containing protein [Phenylobacterium sp.]|uniref:TetR/AcrR family transcriptional regulator n=1 Tax=Phenylobacterium sp. TaxID=1871053 RepID=UPI002869F167|nr:helix-turn-helix domain-containing protein [Phenylobacterium sp.]